MFDRTCKHNCFCTLSVTQPALVSHYLLTSRPVSFAAINCNAKSHTISSQQDASDLDKCAVSGQKIVGEVVISPETATDIEIANFGNIDGTIVATDNPYLESLKLGNATAAAPETSPSLSLSNITSLGSLVFDDSVWRLRDLDLHNLPKLATLDWGVGRPPYYPYVAENLELLEVGSLTLTGLPNLRKIGSSGREIVLSLNMTVKDVALESVDAFTNFTNSRHFAMEGIPNVNRTTFSYMVSESVTIQGNGELDIVFTHPDYRSWYTEADTQTIQDLTISGVKSLERPLNNVEWPYRYLEVGNLTFENNTISNIPLGIFDRITNLYVRNNENLGYLTFPLNFDLFPWENIEITGNPWLTMEDPNFPEILWRWPLLGAQSIIFEVGRGDLFR